MTSQSRRSGVDRGLLTDYRSGKSAATIETLSRLVEKNVITSSGLMEVFNVPISEPLADAARVFFEALCQAVAARDPGRTVEAVKEDLGFSSIHVLRHEMHFFERTLELRKDDRDKHRPSPPTYFTAGPQASVPDLSSFDWPPPDA
ncbi:MAG: hypothetical protein FJ206_13135 [Gemmatimonadetes bacterium]|nr:hypothetical protein [Gemmatimonadota bacterium]